MVKTFLTNPNHIYKFMMVGIICFIFLLPWQSSSINASQTWGLPNRGVFGIRIGEHVLVFISLFFMLLIISLLESKIGNTKNLRLPMLSVFILFLILGSISSILAFDSEGSFFILTSRFSIPAMCIFYITYFCATKINKINLIKFIVVFMSICALYGIFEYIIGENPINNFYGTYFAGNPDPSFFVKTYLYQMGNKAYRITSTFGNSELASSLFVATSILSIAIVNSKKGGHLFIGAFFINSLAFMFTFTRGGILSYIISLSLFTFFVAKKSRFLKNVLAITMIGIIIYMLWDYIGDYVSIRFAGPGSESFESIMHRVYAYEIFIKFIENSTFFGTGLGSTNFYHYYDIYARNIFSSATTFDNAYLSIISGLGIVTIIPIILFIKKLKIILFDSFRNFSDNNYIMKVGLASSLIGILVSFLFYDGFLYLATTSIFFILLGISFSYYDIRNRF
ncbi:O-antigen ligase family protein [Bacteroidota bacterium]